MDRISAAEVVVPDELPRRYRPRTVEQTGQPWLWVRRILPALEFYFAVGCECGRVADGWVQMRCGSSHFVLAHRGEPFRAPGSVLPELTTTDLAGVCSRLRSLGVRTGPVVCAADAPGGRIEVRDPDDNVVVIRQVHTATP